MSITVEVGLLSGKIATVEAHLDEVVQTFIGRAETALGVGPGQLLDSSGSVLDASTPIRDSLLQNGDSLTLHVIGVRVQASALAFAAIRRDGSVVKWGDNTQCGGDDSMLPGQLQTTRQIQASAGAFAAIPKP